MRGHIQQVRRQLVVHADRWIGWLLALVGTAVYLLTLEPSTSFWDCGEFIAVSYYLQVGHPPGAPFYQLIAHLFTLLAGGNSMAVAWWSNALSAVAGGLTVMFLYWTIRLLQCFRPTGARSSLTARRVAALVGSLCYLFCDTAWFSAVESEVYGLAMLIAAIIVWAMLRWYHQPDRSQAVRWLMLVALLLGLGFCTHLLTLLTLPAVLLLFIFGIKKSPYNISSHRSSVFGRRSLVTIICLIFFFAVGLTPYLIIPIRAAAGTPINEGSPSTVATFNSYLSRDQYAKNQPIEREEMRRGDLVFFSSPRSGRGVGHVGIIVDVDRINDTFTFIHASTSEGVTINKSTDGYYGRRYIGVRRVAK